MKMLVFGEAKERGAPHVRDGLCAKSPEVAQDLNEAEEILLNEGDWYNTRQHIRFSTVNNVLPLPRHVSTVLKVGFCNRPGNLWTMSYQYLGGGPGVMDYDCDVWTESAVHEGDFPTFYPLPEDAKDRRLMAFSDRIEDVGKTMRIRGRKENYDEVLLTDEATPGEDIPINYWLQGETGHIDHTRVLVEQGEMMSKTQWTDIDSVHKPRTKGHITLCIYLIDSQNLIFLSKYAPDEEVPQYRRYRVRVPCTCNTPDTTALVKLGHVPLLYDNDVMVVQSQSALNMELKAITQRYRGDMNQATLYHEEALRLLRKQTSNIERPANEIDVMSSEGWGTGPNLRG